MMQPFAQLARSYVCREGAPTLTRIDPAIFQCTYFADCMACGFCHDWCCAHGVDVDLPKANAILARKGEIARFTGVAPELWFDGEVRADPEVPGGQFMRTRRHNGRCVFANPAGRGCQLHRFALANGIDYHQLKPFMSSLFPLTFNDGLLTVSDEIAERYLVCRDQGASCYQGVRGELAYFFGDGLVQELDTLAQRRSAELVGHIVWASRA